MGGMVQVGKGKDWSAQGYEGVHDKHNKSQRGLVRVHERCHVGQGGGAKMHEWHSSG